MNRNIIKSIIFAAVALAAGGAWAETETIGGYTWYYRINGETAEISAISPETGSVTVPATLGGYPVTGIGNSAFWGCANLTSVTIPDSVTSIGDSAFYGCSGLRSVTIPDSVTSIGDYAFLDCSGLTSMTIPDSVTRIGEGAFSGCSGLTSVTIGNGVTSIGAYAFAWCSGLTGVTIPDGVTSIGDDAFYDCSGLTGVTIGNGVTRIGQEAFYNCSGLTSVAIPNSVTSIGDGAFSGCSGLTSVTIGNGVTNIGGGAFWNCSGLTSVTIPNSVTSVGYQAFAGCSGLTSVTIPASVKVIGRCVFLLCDALTNVVVPSWCENAKYDESGVNVVAGAGRSLSANEFRSEVFGCTCEAHDCDATDRCLRAVSQIKITYKDVWDGGRRDGIEPQPTPEPIPAPATPGYEVIEATDIVAPYEVPKTVTLQGAVYDGNDVVGIVELKLGKVNAKKTSKVSGSLTTLDGKKHAIKALTLTEIDGTSPKDASLEVKDFGTMAVTIGGEQFAGSLGKYHVQSAAVGGNWSKGGAKAYVDTAAAALPAGTQERLLPAGEPVEAANGKWKFAKAAGVKWAKPKKGAALPEIYDEEAQKGLVVDTSAGKTNLSGLKLTYVPKKGTFKGSFKVYALEGAGKARKLKKYTVNVSGVVVGGVGYGTAACKRPAAGPWPVTVE